jgi:putative endonuclease
MADHNRLGKEGEDLAVAWFTERGYQVLYTNWRYSYHEIDLIAMHNNVLHFIEVKSRSSYSYGFPEEKVTRGKILRLFKAADEFLYRHPDYHDICFDILSIIKPFGKSAEYYFIEDVYV